MWGTPHDESDAVKDLMSISCPINANNLLARLQSNLPIRHICRSVSGFELGDGATSFAIEVDLADAVDAAGAVD